MEKRLKYKWYKKSDRNIESFNEAAQQIAALVRLNIVWNCCRGTVNCRYIASVGAASELHVRSHQIPSLWSQTGMATVSGCRFALREVEVYGVSSRSC
jgi:hypothetical protein